MTPQFELTGIRYVADAQTILHDIDLTVAPGEYLTLAGPSGSGKSTLLRLLATLLTPTSGTITYAGQPQASYDKIDYRREVSYCFQQPSLFGETVADNLRFPFEIRKQAFDDAQATSALADVALAPTMLEKPITSLSGGEKQRVALIRNLLFTPKVLLLDEITTGLDLDTKNIIHALITKLNAQGITIIAVTHDEGEIQAAHRLIHLVNGTMEAQHD
ncbi:ATP-binding cassette domain-containing protein [Lacticaseibacillus baoqingensis]|uniref:ATP-binding cassette domain-containing protein n=1 Tax=Lacticaseibacillus baoqingensis TaxID=2486013 RepID=A0ABW4E5J3_9LACO|nr:ATP-binding cassette domain-containing protein [Lacticaseibacillus baoqingensis]